MTKFFLFIYLFIFIYFFSDPPVDDNVVKATAFIDKLCDQNGQIERPLRGPYLAQLHLVKMCLEGSNDNSEVTGKFNNIKY